MGNNFNFRQKNKRTEELAVARLTVASETMQQEESINLLQSENQFSLCCKSILSTIGNRQFPMYSLATAKLQILKNAKHHREVPHWLMLNLMYLCTYVQKLKRDSSSRWSSE